ncbi:MAG: phosphatidyl-myo-inositol dimannoside synthase [Nocardioidaceae bacterium]|nr:phosphatidyl-myo-inositol dimannoside synthase [Nocardioidaceae bacterium]
MPADPGPRAKSCVRGAGGTGRILLVTNDYPPRRGGIESFVFSLCAGLPPSDLVVYTARMRGSASIDRQVAYEVIRDGSRLLLPTPRVARAVRDLMIEQGCDRVAFGAAAPLGLLAGGLRASGARRLVGLTHGHEVWWAKVPGARALLRRIGREVDVLTYVSDFCGAEIAKALRPVDARAMVRMSPGVDLDVFRPGLDGGPVRRSLGIGDAQQVVVAASRLVARKGHDVLLEAWPRVVARHPDAVLLVVGSGPARRRLARKARGLTVAGSVRFLAGVAWSDMPAVYAAGDVFAMPCRTRLRGLEPEALGIVFLEAAACGLPVVVGASGGAPETAIDGETGYVVDPRSTREVAARITSLLADPEQAKAMGLRGREWVRRAYSPGTAAATLSRVLATGGP